jgi:hypothetical protein
MAKSTALTDWSEVTTKSKTIHLRRVLRDDGRKANCTVTVYHGPGVCLIQARGAHGYVRNFESLTMAKNWIDSGLREIKIAAV